MPKDDEINGATGTSYDFGARLLDPRVGRWLSLDPLAQKYADLSPYAFVGNTPIMAKDPDGKKIVIHYTDAKGRDKKVVLKKMTDVETKLLVRANATGNQFLTDAYETLNYLSSEPAIQEAVNHRTALDVHEVSDPSQSSIYETGVGGASLCVPGSYTLTYNSREAIETVTDAEAVKLPGERVGTGEIQSPALGFLHEIGHFLHVANSPDFTAHDVLQGTELPLWDNAEEQRNTMEVETPAAIRLGEPTRTNHKGIGREVASPTSRTPLGPAIKQKNVKGL